MRPSEARAGGSATKERWPARIAANAAPQDARRVGAMFRLNGSASSGIRAEPGDTMHREVTPTKWPRRVASPLLAVLLHALVAALLSRSGKRAAVPTTPSPIEEVAIDLVLGDRSPA